MKLLTPILLTSLSTIALADTTLTFTGKNDSPAMEMMIAGNHMRATSLGQSDSYMIYDSENQTFTIIMTKEKEFMSFGPKQIEALGDMATLMMKQIDKQLAQMPESQRAMMRDMMMKTMKSQMPKQAPAPSYKMTGKSTEINGFDCEIVIKKSESGESEFCITEYSDLGMNSNEYAVIQSFQKIMVKLATQFGQDSSMDFSALGDFVPVKYQNSNETGELQSVSHNNIQASMFMVPEGYTKKEIPLEF
jgi:hypothetical protein